MDVFNRALESIRRLWGNLTVSQRVLLGASAALMALLLVWGSAVTAGDAWVRVVGHEVTDPERADVLKRLQQSNQRYEVRDRDIYVPKQDADRVVLDLAGEGTLSDRAVWQFLAESDIIATKWQLEKRFQVALQQKLEMMVRKMDVVRNASVQISPASEAKQLGFTGPQASASVQVELQPGRTLEDHQVMAIAGLVAAAVGGGLQRDQVLIADTHGVPYHVLKENSSAAAAIDHRRYEQQIENTIRNDILHNLKSARVVVRVTARNTDIERVSIKRTNPKIYDEEDRKRTDKSKAGAAPSGIKGEGNLPQTSEGALTGRDELEQESRAKTAFDEDHVNTKDPAGMIEKVTVGVLYPIDTDKEGKELEGQLTLEQVKDFVMAAAGPKADADSVKIALVKTRRPEPIAIPGFAERAAEWLQAKWTTLALIALAFFGVLVMLRIARGALARNTFEEIQSLSTQMTERLEGTGPVETVGAEDAIGKVKQGIREIVLRNPGAAGGSLKQFMAGK